MGRKSKYPTHVEPRLDEIEQWCRDGLIEEEICRKLDVNVNSFNEYKKEFPELTEFLKRGKVKADHEVERSLFERANGYSHKEDEIFVYKGEVIIVPTIKHYPPEVTACIFWLKNRRPDLWQDTKKLEVDAENLGVIMIPVRKEVGAPVDPALLNRPEHKMIEGG